MSATASETAAPAPSPQESASSESSGFDKALALLEGKASAADESAAPQEEPKTEAAPAEQHQPDGGAPAAKTAEDKFTAKFEQLRKEGARLEQQRAKMKDQIDELAKIKGDLEEAKLNPNKMLEILGISQDDLTKRLIQSGGDVGPELKIALEAKQEAKKLAERLREKEEQEALDKQQKLLDNYRTDVSSFIDQSEEHELVKTFGVVDAVIDEINQHWEKTFDEEQKAGEILSYKQAADIVEKRLEESAVFQRILKAQKVAKKLTPVSPKLDSTPRTRSAAQKTITGAMAPQTGVSKGPQTPEERFDAAVRLLSGGAPE